MTTTLHSSNWSLPLANDINAAQRSVFVTALSFLPPRTLKPDDFTGFWLALVAAARRGVSVQVALPSSTAAHPATLRNAFAAIQLQEVGITAHAVPPSNLLHAKTVCIDAAVAWVGSGNMTAAAAHHNRECWLRTDDARPVAELVGFHAQCVSAARAAA